MARGGLIDCLNREPKEAAFINTENPGRPPGPRGDGAGRASLLTLVGFLGLTLLVGAAAGAINATSVHGWYLSLTPPPGTPPNWLFGPVWTVLYVLVAVAAWLVWRTGPQEAGPLSDIGPYSTGPHAPEGPRTRRALRLWGWQLLANAAWTPAFFGLHSPRLALGVMVVLVLLIVSTMRAFAPISRVASGLMLPYLAWTCYAAYLTAGFVWLNPHG